MMALVLAALCLADPVAQDLASIPSPYYLDLPCPGPTVGGVQQAMGAGIAVPYQQDVFDCSNRAAYLQWRLKSQGYNASICLSKHFRGSLAHAWVSVELKGTRYYIDPVEAALIAVGPGRRDYQYYDAWEQSYSSLQELVLEHPLADFVWWERLNYSAEARGLGA